MDEQYYMLETRERLVKIETTLKDHIEDEDEKLDKLIITVAQIDIEMRKWRWFRNTVLYLSGIGATLVGATTYYWPVISRFMHHIVGLKDP